MNQKIFVKICKKLSSEHLIDQIDLIDFFLDLQEEIKNFNSNFKCYDLLQDIANTDEAWFYSASLPDLILMFDRVRDAVHNSGRLLELLFPNLDKEFFDLLSK